MGFLKAWESNLSYEKGEGLPISSL